MSSYSAAASIRAAMVVLALLTATAAGAQQPSANAIATAKEILAVKGTAAFYHPLLAGVIERTKDIFLRTNPMLSKDLNEVAAKLRADYAPRSEEVVAETAKLYAVKFNEQELKDLLAFYKSPLGRKVLTEEPAIVDQSMKAASAWAEKLSEEVMGRIRAEMRKRGHEI